MNIRCLGCNSIYDSSSVFRRAATGEYMIMLTKSRCRFDINGLTMRVPQDAFIICDGRLPVVYSAEDSPLIQITVNTQTILTQIQKSRSLSRTRRKVLRKLLQNRRKIVKTLIQVKLL